MPNNRGCSKTFDDLPLHAKRVCLDLEERNVMSRHQYVDAYFCDAEGEKLMPNSIEHERVYPCPQCGKRFVRGDSVERHIRYAHAAPNIVEYRTDDEGVAWRGELDGDQWRVTRVDLHPFIPITSDGDLSPGSFRPFPPDTNPADAIKEVPEKPKGPELNSMGQPRRRLKRL